jgi:hypothetical protein
MRQQPRFSRPAVKRQKIALLDQTRHAKQGSGLLLVLSIEEIRVLLLTITSSLLGACHMYW